MTASEIAADAEDRLFNARWPDSRRAVDRWEPDQLPATASMADNPLIGLSDATKAVMNALRARSLGAGVGMVAALSGVSRSHTARCLRRLYERGWADSRIAWVPIGYSSARRRIWQLTWSDECTQALGFLRRLPTCAVVDAEPDRIPPHFWDNFWSGTPADQLSIKRHGLYIAEALINGRDVHARAWALTALPIEVLRECRGLRGCDTGTPARWIDIALKTRAAPEIRADA